MKAYINRLLAATRETASGAATILLLGLHLAACSSHSRQTDQKIGAGPGAPDGPRLTTLADVIACTHAALGGAAALDSISSLTVSGEIEPEGGSTGRWRASGARREVTISLAGRYKNINRSVQPNDGTPHIDVVGFDGDRSFYGTASGGGRIVPLETDQESLTMLRRTFAQYVLAWLLRSTPTMPLVFSFGGFDPGTGHEHVAISAAGPNALNAVLVVSATSCMPVALAYRRPANIRDAMTERPKGDTAGSRLAACAAGSSSTSTVTECLSLSDYRSVHGVLFPGVMQTIADGVPIGRWRITAVAVNPRVRASFFSLTDSPAPTE